MTKKTETTVTVQFPSEMSIRLASAYLDMNPNYIMKLAKAGKIAAEKADGKWIFKVADLDAYKAGNNGNGKANNGSAYRIRVTDDKLEAAKAALAEMGIELTPIKPYVKKAKAEAEIEAGPVEEPTEA